MAENSSITFTGPSATDPTNTKFVPIVVSIDDASFAIAVEAVCANMGYQQLIVNEVGETVINPQGPGQFVIQKNLDWYHAHVIEYLKSEAITDAHALAVAQAEKQIAQFVVPTI